MAKTRPAFSPYLHDLIGQAMVWQDDMIMAFWKQRVGRGATNFKDPRLVVTAIDRRMERKMAQACHELGFGYSGEELRSTIEKPFERFGIGDGVDGSLHFVGFGGEWGVQLAICDNFGQSVESAIIIRPVLRRMLVAERGKGVWFFDLNGWRRIKSRPDEALPVFPVIAGWPSGLTDKPEALNHPLFVSLRKFCNLNLNCGSSAVATWDLVMGSVSGVLMLEEKPWDLLPRLLMAEELGGSSKVWSSNRWLDPILADGESWWRYRMAKSRRDLTTTLAARTPKILELLSLRLTGFSE